MTDTTIDVVDEITEDAVADLRHRRPVTRAQLQASFDALFAPVDDSEVSLEEDRKSVV